MIENLSRATCWIAIALFVTLQQLTCWSFPSAAYAALSGLTLLCCAVEEGLIVAVLALGSKLAGFADDPHGERRRRRIGFVLYSLATVYPHWEVVPWLLLGVAALRLGRHRYLRRVVTGLVALAVMGIASQMDTWIFGTRGRHIAMLAFGIVVAVLIVHALLPDARERGVEGRA